MPTRSLPGTTVAVAVPAAIAVWDRQSPTRAPAGWRAWRAAGALVCLGLFVAMEVDLALRSYASGPVPSIAAADLYGAFADATPVTVRFQVAGDTVAWPTTADDLRGNVSLWRRMHLADWNGVPAPLREQSLDNMFRRYERVLMNPDTWDVMTPGD